MLVFMKLLADPKTQGTHTILSTVERGKGSYMQRRKNREASF